MFNTLGVALWVLVLSLWLCTGREMNSLHIDELTNFSTRKAAYRGQRPNQFRFYLLTLVWEVRIVEYGAKRYFILFFIPTFRSYCSPTITTLNKLFNNVTINISS